MNTTEELNSAINNSYYVNSSSDRTYDKEEVINSVRHALLFTHSMIEHRPDRKTVMYQLKNTILRKIIKQKILNNLYKGLLDHYNMCRNYLSELIDNPNMFGDKYKHHSEEKENINLSFKLKKEMSDIDKALKQTEESKFKDIDNLKQYERACAS